MSDLPIVAVGSDFGDYSGLLPVLRCDPETGGKKALREMCDKLWPDIQELMAAGAPKPAWRRRLRTDVYDGPTAPAAGSYIEFFTAEGTVTLFAPREVSDARCAKISQALQGGC